MNTREEQLRAELRAESELITPGSLRQLDFHQADDLASTFGRRPASDRRRLRVAWLAPVATAVAVAVIVATAAAISLHRPSAGQQPTGAGEQAEGQITSVAALSARDVWAVGNLEPNFPRSYHDAPLIEHWNGSGWRRVAMPNKRGGIELNSIAGTSSDNLWAVGGWREPARSMQAMIMHWNGRTWRRQLFAASTQAGLLQKVTVVSATDAWAVGQTMQHDPTALVLHWNGSRWSKVPVPAVAGDGFLHGIAAVSARNVWAVGGTGNPRTGVSELYIIHWNGSAWTQVPAPNPHRVLPSLLSVAVGPDGTAWAVGLAGEQPLVPVALRWSGTAWQQVPIRGLKASLSAVTVLSRTIAWAAGQGDGPQDTVLLRWNGATWTRIISPGANFRGGINDLAATSPGDVWAAGYRGAWYAGVPQILHWNGLKWTRSFGPASNSGLPNPTPTPFHS